MRQLVLILIILLLAACAPAPAAPTATLAATLAAPQVQPTPLPDPTADRAREYLDLYETQQFEQLFAHFSPMLQEAAPLDALPQVWQDLRAEYGAPLGVLRESLVPGCGYIIYYRYLRHEKEAEVVYEMGLEYDLQTIVYLSINTPSQPAKNPYGDYQTLTSLRLPFEGQWCVAHGGRDFEHNYHGIVSNQRFAYDFFIIQNGRTYQGDGASNEDYFCFGQPILAPADGTVVMVVDGVVDNIPGQQNALQAAGNYIIIDHGNQEYSLMAHLQNGSITVQEQQSVTAGQVIGLCGNSGNSTEAHLHYHLQDQPVFGKGDGKPAPFRNYLADGVLIELGEPIRGQIIELGE